MSSASLHTAIQNGNMTAVEVWLASVDSIEQINQPMHDHRFVLTFSGEYDSDDDVVGSASVNEFYTPLMHAAMVGNSHIVQAIVNRILALCGNDEDRAAEVIRTTTVGITLPNGGYIREKSALDIAAANDSSAIDDGGARKGHRDCVWILLAHGYTPFLESNQTRQDIANAVTFAAKGTQSRETLERLHAENPTDYEKAIRNTIAAVYNVADGVARNIRGALTTAGWDEAKRGASERTREAEDEPLVHRRSSSESKKKR